MDIFQYTYENCDLWIMDLPRATGEIKCVIKHSSELETFYTFLTQKSRQSFVKKS